MSFSSLVNLLASLEQEVYVRLLKSAEDMAALDFPDPLGKANKERVELTRRALGALDEAIELAQKNQSSKTSG